jgi:hypothetical protein
MIIGFIPKAEAQAAPPQFVGPPWVSPEPNQPGYVWIITPHDNATVWANVSSLIGIRDVIIYYRISKTSITRFNSTADFTKQNMTWWSFWLPRSNGLWNYTFKEQPNGTIIYYYLDVFDALGQDTPWRNYLAPGEIQILTPGPSDILQFGLALNNILLNGKYEGANVTILLSAFLPSHPPYYAEPYSLGVQVSGGISSLDLSENGRFHYLGSVTEYLSFTKGSLDDAPYDVYTLDILLTIPYAVEKASGLAYPIPMTIREFPGWDTWNVSLQNQGKYPRQDNTTVVWLEYKLSRLVPTYYPPLVLLLATMAILGLTPLVAYYYETRRFDVFLNAIILAASAELSNSINPLGGFLQSGVFSRLFAFSMVGTVVLMTMYSKPILQKRILVSLLRTVVTSAILLSIAIYFAWTTNLPTLAKEWLIGTSVFGSAITVILVSIEKYLKDRSQLHPDDFSPSVNYPI